MTKWENWKILYCFMNEDPPDEKSITMTYGGVPSEDAIKQEIIQQHPIYEKLMYSFKYLSHQKQ